MYIIKKCRKYKLYYLFKFLITLSAASDSCILFENADKR